MTQKTKTSTPLLSEAARHVVIPKGIKTTGWPAVIAFCADAGIFFDPWQHGVGRVSLGKTANGKYAATVGGIVLSIPRQVGKTFLIGMIVIALCVLNPGMTVIWTAHRTRTATNTFRSFQGMVRKKKVYPHLAPNGIRTANGEQEIKFHNGSIIMFGAREQGFGRGFDEVDIEVFDEAQILTAKALEDMVAATNQSRQPSGALLFFMGTPPRPVDPGEEFRNRRTKALSGKATNMVYVEFSADDTADCDDRDQWERANPSFPVRTPLESMERMREQLTDDDSFRREALGIWDSDGRVSLFDAAAWEAGRREVRPADLTVDALALAVSIDLGHSAIVAASEDEDGGAWVKPLQHGPGTKGVVERCVELQAMFGVDVVIDGRGPGAVLIPHLEKAGVRLHIASTGDVLDAFANLETRIRDGQFFHVHAPELDAAAAGAVRRAVGDRSALGRKKSEADISPLEAASLAAWRAGVAPAVTESAYEDEDLMVV